MENMMEGIEQEEIVMDEALEQRRIRLKCLVKVKKQLKTITDTIILAMPFVGDQEILREYHNTFEEYVDMIDTDISDEVERIHDQKEELIARRTQERRKNGNEDKNNPKHTQHLSLIHI